MSNSTTNGTNNANNNCNKLIQLELTNEIKQLEIVTSFTFDTEIQCFSLELNHKYNRKKITSPLKSDWPATMKILKQELNRKNVRLEHIPMLCDVADNAADKILKWRMKKQAEEDEKADDRRQESVAQEMIDLVEEQCEELFVDQYGEPYASVRVREHLETLNLNHARFRNWVCKAYYEMKDAVPNSENVASALNVPKARAEFDGNSKELHLRCIWYIRYRKGEQ